MNTTKEYNPGDTLCTCRVGEDRYEIKIAEHGICGSITEDCHFLSLSEDDCFSYKDSCPRFTRICKEHDVYFIKIQQKEQP